MRGFTHTYSGKGGQGSQPQQTTGKRKKNNKADNRQGEHTISRQNQGREGKRWGRKHTGTQHNPTLARRRATAQSRTGDKAKNSSETTEAGQHKEVTNLAMRQRDWEGVRMEKGAERGGRKKDGKERGGGCPKLCILHPRARRGRRKVRLAKPKHPGSHQKPGGGGLCQVAIIKKLLFSVNFQPHGLLSDGAHKSVRLCPITLQIESLITLKWAFYDVDKIGALRLPRSKS